mmetsp:Transcript_92990/g.240264  ORF Transcript_92990/g.240264 Transcript_92990/m.240264 type:complete len:424 (+) Transcript_92990:2004-3275(+)
MVVGMLDHRRGRGLRNRSARGQVQGLRVRLRRAHGRRVGRGGQDRIDEVLQAILQVLLQRLGLVEHLLQQVKELLARAGAVVVAVHAQEEPLDVLAPGVHADVLEHAGQGAPRDPAVAHGVRVLEGLDHLELQARFAQVAALFLPLVHPRRLGRRHRHVEDANRVLLGSLVERAVVVLHHPGGLHLDEGVVRLRAVEQHIALPRRHVQHQARLAHALITLHRIGIKHLEDQGVTLLVLGEHGTEVPLRVQVAVHFFGPDQRVWLAFNLHSDVWVRDVTWHPLHVREVLGRFHRDDERSHAGLFLRRGGRNGARHQPVDRRGRGRQGALRRRRGGERRGRRLIRAVLAVADSVVQAFHRDAVSVMAPVLEDVSLPVRQRGGQAVARVGMQLVVLVAALGVQGAPGNAEEINEVIQWRQGRCQHR